MATLVILFATDQGDASPSIDINFSTKTVEQVLAISNTIRVGGTVNPWATYVVSAEDNLISESAG